MLITPELASLGSTILDGVSTIAVDRDVERLAIDWAHQGPFPTFADVPQQRVTIRIARRFAGPSDGPLLLRPGELTTLAAVFAPTTSSAQRRRLRANVVIASLTYQFPGVDAPGPQRTATQLITLLALSTDGAADPITIEPA